MRPEELVRSRLNRVSHEIRLLLGHASRRSRSNRPHSLAEVAALWLLRIDLEGDIVAVAAALEDGLLWLLWVLGRVRRLLLPVVSAAASLGRVVALSGTLVVIAVVIALGCRGRHVCYCFDSA